MDIDGEGFQGPPIVGPHSHTTPKNLGVLHLINLLKCKHSVILMDLKSIWGLFVVFSIPWGANNLHHWKIKMLNPNHGRFGSSDFPFQLGDV